MYVMCVVIDDTIGIYYEISLGAKKGGVKSIISQAANLKTLWGYAITN